MHIMQIKKCFKSIAYDQVVFILTYSLILLCVQVSSDELNGQTRTYVKIVEKPNNSTPNTDDILRKKIEAFRNMVYLYYLPIIVLIGIIGNSLTLVILFFEKKLLSLYDVTKPFKANIESSLNTNNNNNNKQTNGVKNNKRMVSISSGVQFSSSNYFIASLAVSDLIYNVILLCVWITRIGFNVLNIRYICEISVALSYICSFLSAAFTTCFTFQRFMAVVYPLKSATSVSLQSKLKIKILIFILIVFSMVTYSFSLFMYDAEPKKEHEESTQLQNVCGIKYGYSNVVNIIDNTLDSFLTLIVPSFCIVFMNIGIIKAVTTKSEDGFLKRISNKKKRNNNEKSNFSKRNEESNFIENDQHLNTENSQITRVKESDLQITTGQKFACSTSSHITKTLLVVSFFFILLNSPYRASKLLSYINLISKKTEVYSNFDFVLNEVLINLYFTSYSVNFFLYSLCGKKFRGSLKALIFPIISFLFRIFSLFLKKK